MKVIATLLVLLLFASSSYADKNVNAEAKAIYAPQTESYSGNFPYPLSLPYLGTQHGPGHGKKEIVILPWDEIPIEALEPRFSWSDLNPFSGKDYKKSIWFKEEPGDEPIRVLREIPDDLPLLGQIRTKNKGDEAPLEVVRNTIWRIRNAMGAKHVLVVSRHMPVAKGSSMGIGGTTVKSELSSERDQGITVGGSGLWSRSSGWIQEGAEITIYGYGEGRREHSSAPKRSAPKKSENSVDELKRLLGGE